MMEYDEKLMGPASADTDQAQATLAKEFEKMREEANRPPSVYHFDISKIKTLKDVREFIKEMGPTITLYPGVTPEMIGRRSEYWIMAKEPLEGESEDVTITDL
jgi:hypothetical protein